MWDSYTDEQKEQFLSSLCGVEAQVDYNSIHLAETYLSQEQKVLYVDYCTAHVSHTTYAKHSPTAPETVRHYYFNMMHLDCRVKAKMMWHAVNGTPP